MRVVTIEEVLTASEEQSAALIEQDAVARPHRGGGPCLWLRDRGIPRSLFRLVVRRDELDEQWTYDGELDDGARRPSPPGERSLGLRRHRIACRLVASAPGELAPTGIGDTDERVVWLYDWWFKVDGNIRRGLAAAGEHAEALRDEALAPCCSLWMRPLQQERRSLHVAIFADQDRADAAFAHPATARLWRRLNPEIVHDRSLRVLGCDIAFCSGGKIEAIEDFSIERDPPVLAPEATPYGGPRPSELDGSPASPDRAG